MDSFTGVVAAADLESGRRTAGTVLLYQPIRMQYIKSFRVTVVRWIK
jgi:hypothetical protein